MFFHLLGKEDGKIKDFQLYLEYEKDVTESRLKIIDRFQKSLKKKPAKRTSMIDVVEQVLRNAERPLHISEIIEIAARDYGAQLERDSVVSFIIKRMTAAKTFTRTAPNTFTLREQLFTR